MADADLIPFPADRVAPVSRAVELEGEPVTVIYLPWRHDTEEGPRPAGLYVHGQGRQGFVPDPDRDGLEACLRRAATAWPTTDG
ncbi:hypothetical protein BJF82_02510 [Kytococcus sp. CUA-901]|nr:hypothetical protein BJF82_02510 [Kytococcus sp. CUA-901]